MILFFKYSILTIILSFCLQSFAADAEILSLLAANKGKLDERISSVSEKLLGRPYMLFALGEGANGKFNTRPLYRTDVFDCETFVDTVLAIVNSEDMLSFKQQINNIRYKHGKPNFFARNHFTNLDWNINNQKKAYIKDITHNLQVYRTSRTYINKKNWYKHLQPNVIILNASDDKKKQQLFRLRSLGYQNSSNAYSVLNYIPLSALFVEQRPVNSLFKQIPNGAIIEIVRPNWDLERTIGTKLDISHLGFAIWKNGNLYFRNASSIHNKIVDEKLSDYLQKYIHSPTVKGINIEQPLALL